MHNTQSYVKVHVGVLERLNVPEKINLGENPQVPAPPKKKKGKKTSPADARAKRRNKAMAFLKELVMESMTFLSKTVIDEDVPFGEVSFNTLITFVVNGDIDLVSLQYSNKEIWNWLAYSPLTGGESMRVLIMENTQALSWILDVAFINCELEFHRISNLERTPIRSGMHTGKILTGFWRCARTVWNELSVQICVFPSFQNTLVIIIGTYYASTRLPTNQKP